MAGNPEREVLTCGWIRMMRVRCGRLTPGRKRGDLRKNENTSNEKIMKA